MFGSQGALESKGIPTRVQTAIEMRAEPYIRRESSETFREKEVVIFACGTGIHFFNGHHCSTPERRKLMQKLLLAKKVDAVYDSDPEYQSKCSSLTGSHI